MRGVEGLCTTHTPQLRSYACPTISPGSWIPIPMMASLVETARNRVVRTAHSNGNDLSAQTIRSETYLRYPSTLHGSADQPTFSNDPYEEDALLIEKADGEKDIMSTEPWRQTALKLLPFNSIPSLLANIWMTAVQAQTLRKARRSESPPRGLLIAWGFLIIEMGLFGKTPIGDYIYIYIHTHTCIRDECSVFSPPDSLAARTIRDQYGDFLERNPPSTATRGPERPKCRCYHTVLQRGHGYHCRHGTSRTGTGLSQAPVPGYRYRRR
jgi:hypothetical protein